KHVYEVRRIWRSATAAKPERELAKQQRGLSSAIDRLSEDLHSFRTCAVRIVGFGGTAGFGVNHFAAVLRSERDGHSEIKPCRHLHRSTAIGVGDVEVIEIAHCRIIEFGEGVAQRVA